MGPVAAQEPIYVYVFDDDRLGFAADSILTATSCETKLVSGRESTHVTL